MQEFAWIGQLVMGYLVQWARAKKNYPNWISYALLVVGTVAIYWWMTPDSVAAFHTNWRLVIAQIITFGLAIRGSAAASKDAMVAPPTNSI